MSDALKRIEEKHKEGRQWHLPPCTKDPCDVVKLARALDRILKTALPIMEEDTEAFAEGRRTLEEVAGEGR